MYGQYSSISTVIPGQVKCCLMRAVSFLPKWPSVRAKCALFIMVWRLESGNTILVQMVLSSSLLWWTRVCPPSSSHCFASLLGYVDEPVVDSFCCLMRPAQSETAGVKSGNSSGLGRLASSTTCTGDGVKSGAGQVWK